jgi:hypothetical protein
LHFETAPLSPLAPVPSVRLCTVFEPALDWQVFAATPCMMMLQELYERWAEIQKEDSEGKMAANRPERISEELNILEALRISGCKVIPGETSGVQVLIDKRYKQLEEILRKRNG